MGTSLNNLAMLYQAQGRYTEAEPLYRRSLAIREKALGLDHPDVGEPASFLNLEQAHRPSWQTECKRTGVWLDGPA